MTTHTTPAVAIAGIDLAALDQLRRTGIDHGGNPVEPFLDETGGWPLRCCLTDSEPGDRVAIVSWSPFPWTGAYRELGPIVVHAEHCPRPHDGSFPAQFEQRRQTLRPYGADHRIAYQHAVIVEPGTGLEATIDRLLADPAIEFVHARNVLAGCYSFTATLQGRVATDG